MRLHPRAGSEAGIYSTPWITSYAGFVGGSSDDPDGGWQPSAKRGKCYRHGKYHFETHDVQQWVEWGFDYIKYDWGVDSPEVARRLTDALGACDRDLVYKMSNSIPLARACDFTALAQVNRTTGDLLDLWDRPQVAGGRRPGGVTIRDVWIQHDAFAQYRIPGHWNHACNLPVGLLWGWKWNRPPVPSRLTPDEQYSHISLWCLWGSPMIIGTPIETLDAFTLSLLSNDEVLEVNQDSLGHQARRTKLTDEGKALCKLLEDGSRAVGLFNLGKQEASLRVTWSALGLKRPQRVRDLWRQKDLGTFADSMESQVAPHGVLLLRLVAEDDASGS